MSALMLSHVSEQRQHLILLCQRITYGQIVGLEVRNGEPVFDASASVLVDVNLDALEHARPELALKDFALRDEVLRLLVELGRFSNGKISRIEIRAGLPRRILFESQVGRMLP